MMDYRTIRRIDDMQAEIGRLRRELDQRPLISVGSASVKFQVANIIGGNTLSTGQSGINYSASQITTVPSAYDPDIDVAFIDGIGRATYYINGTLQTSNILIANCASIGSPMSRSLLAGVMVRVISTTSILVGAGPSTVTAYVIAFL
jgi:hypothetical protein